MSKKKTDNEKLVGSIVSAMKRKAEENRDTEAMPSLPLDEPHSVASDGTTITKKNHLNFTTYEEDRINNALKVFDASSVELAKLKLATMTEDELHEIKEERRKALFIPEPLELDGGHTWLFDAGKKEGHQEQDLRLGDYERSGDKKAWEKNRSPETMKLVKLAKVRAENKARVEMIGKVLEEEFSRRSKGSEEMEDGRVDAKENEAEKRESREGVWTEQGTRAPNRLRKLLMKIVFDATREGFSSQEAFEMWRNNEEVRGIIASHYNKRCRTWSHEEWIDNAKARLRADGKSLLRRFGTLPPNFPQDIMRKGKEADFLTQMMLTGGMELSQVEARDTKGKRKKS